MFKTTAFLGLVLSVQAAQAAEISQSRTYEVQVAPQAKAYTGERFSRRFDLEETFEVGGPVVANAVTQDAVSCDTDDDSRPVNCQDICTSSVIFQVGTVALKATDLDSGRSRVSDSKAITAGANAVLPGKCNGRVPEITDGRFEVAATQVPYLNVSFGRDGTQEIHLSSDGNIRGTLRALGRNRYEFTGLELPAQLAGSYGYNEVATWGVSGVVTLRSN